MERQRDEERAPLPVRIQFPPSPPIISTPPRQVRAAVALEQVTRVFRTGADKLKHRRTVVLSTVELYRMLTFMGEHETSSEWIRQAVAERLDRLTKGADSGDQR
jgi:hypothetical protein